MNYFDEIRSKLEDAEISATQAKALLDALALVMAAEGDVNERETSHTSDICAALADKTTIDTDGYLKQALATAADIAGDADAIDAQARDIANRLGDAVLREEAYYLSIRIAAADVNVVGPETQVLSSYVQSFDIPRERRSRLTQRAREIM